MPNLYGSSVEGDIEDYRKMFSDPDFCPDELKIYPCSLIESAELMQYYEKGLWKPYTHEELLDVLTATLELTPEYCRLTRVVRDIPSTDIVVGNKLTNFREIAETEAKKRGIRRGEIRSREIRNQTVTMDELRLDETAFETSCGDEVFLQYITEDRKIAGFLRLSLPTEPPITDELDGAAMIREVHVYGQSLKIGEAGKGYTQHLGLGKRLIERAVDIAIEKGYKRLAVISAIGTRDYYIQRGFSEVQAGNLYQVRELV
jgi:elongator complex protein 3